MTNTVPGTSILSRSVRDLLADRVLIVVGDTNAMQHVTLVDRDLEGLVLTSRNSIADVTQISRYVPQVVTIVEPRYAMTEFATPERPLILPDDDGLIAFTVDDVLSQQLDTGARIAMTPTGFVRAGEPDTLRAVVEVSRSVSRDDTLHRVFLSPKYFRPENLRQTIAILRKCELPIALTVASKTDPMAESGIVEGLREAFAVLDWAMPWRTDLAGFDGVAHGARSAAFGTLPSTRHGVAPDQRGQRSPGDRSPSVLVLRLGRYIRSGQLRHLYAQITAPLCWCAVCGGRPLDRFENNTADHLTAMRHNMLAIRELRQHLQATPDMRAAWYAYMDEAVLAHAELESLTSVKVKVPAVLQRWAKRQDDIAARSVSSNSQHAGV